MKISHGKITSTTARIDNHKILRWFYAVNFGKKCAMNSRRFRLGDDVKAVPPGSVTGPRTLNETRRDGGLSHDVAAFCIPRGGNCQPDICGI